MSPGERALAYDLPGFSRCHFIGVERVEATVELVSLGLGAWHGLLVGTGMLSERLRKQNGLGRRKMGDVDIVIHRKSLAPFRTWSNAGFRLA